MQDSLGGNAKTLMFVNISPADYNQDETVTALTYATRVKLITNTAEKQQVRARSLSIGRTQLFSHPTCLLLLLAGPFLRSSLLLLKRPPTYSSLRVLYTWYGVFA